MAKATFRAGEIVEMAVLVEKQGIAFYEACLRGPLPAEVGRVFGYLLEQEREHVGIFTAMRQSLAQYHLPESYAGEAESFRASFVARKVFPTSRGAQGERFEDASSAIGFAMDMEERSILLYRQMRTLVPPSARAAIERIIAEERLHREQLEHLYREIRQP